ncbi:flavodoxin family protein [Bacteroides helcogenes]|uniref:NADPH-dependent FMN reductase n=1 Tax=Bacteroides helcogenes (strain ATCC 35417 / DSM 20613 / JCM 6297 / CCUG 15421 / P 36-108) TaxID=693979 RepID=E6SPX2_BACT6|nr:flavodoxin family protein [Bacteroides helcogenes]ADV44951.1 NADPH-dependent FMN reductase [Bacteroides helcogenes P 36-108]MDY5239807.1 flavodoxin family protein [Bacteroides helcogenes]
MKNVLVIKTSPRKGGNSDRLADEFIKGATEAGNHVEEVSLVGKNIQFCRGCLTCQKTQRCVIKDDAVAICEKMLNADVIVWATPVYYYCISGQMKTMIDRANPLYGMDYKFRDIYLLATAAEDEPTTVEGSVKATQGWVDCFAKATLQKVVFAGGVNDKGDIEGHPSLKEAYELGKRIQ